MDSPTYGSEQTSPPASGLDQDVEGMSEESSPPNPAATPNEISSSRPTVNISTWRRVVITFTMCWMAFPAAFIHSSLLAAYPEAAKGLSVSEHAINAANSGVFVVMALSVFLWLPLITMMGRRPALITATASLCVCSIGEGLAPDMPTFATIWSINGLLVVVFFMAGQSIIDDVFSEVSSVFLTRGHIVNGSVGIQKTRRIMSIMFVASNLAAQMTGTNKIPIINQCFSIL